MRQNTSYIDNPAFWDASFVPALHDLGYTTGLFGAAEIAFGYFVSTWRKNSLRYCEETASHDCRQGAERYGLIRLR
jgi:hypothetical protein